MRLDPRLYSRLIYDSELPHGAFRLWHYILDRQGKNECAWPSLERICEDIGCGRAALLGWIKILVKRGYLEVRKGNSASPNRYSIVSSSQSRSSSQNSTSSRGAVPEAVRGSSKQVLQLNPMNGTQERGKAAPPFKLSPSEAITLERERTRLTQRSLSIKRSPMPSQSDIKEYNDNAKTITQINATLQHHTTALCLAHAILPATN